MSNIDKVLDFYSDILPKAGEVYARVYRQLSKIEVSIYISDVLVNEASGATAEEAAGVMLAELPVKASKVDSGLWPPPPTRA